MIIIAFTFTTNDLEYVVLSGSMEKPHLDSKAKLLLPKNFDIPKTVSWFESEIELLLNNIQPDQVIYRLTIMRITNLYVSNVFYGQAILNLLCYKKGIKILSASPVSITAKRLNLDKGTDLPNHLESVVGKQTPPWDSNIKATGLLALIHMK